MAADGDARDGHWLSMSYEHDPSVGAQLRHWHIKDSLKPNQVERVSWASAIAELSAADTAQCDWFVVLDCS